MPQIIKSVDDWDVLRKKSEFNKVMKAILSALIDFRADHKSFFDYEDPDEAERI